MKKVMELFYKLNSKQKLFIFAILFMIVFFVSFGIPSLARYKNRVPIDNTETWDGVTATSYRKGSGTEIDPYIISNASELSYFSNMANTTDYTDTYFRLNNNIIINNGVFSYGEDGILYTLNNTAFYVKEYTNEFYDNKDYTGIKIGTINLFNSINNFKGNFDGNGYTIYGAYITGIDTSLGLFNNLEGNIHDLYVKNTFVNGNNVSGGVVSNSNNSILKNVVFDGFVIGDNAGGIIANSNNSSLENVINKSYVKGTSNGSGLICNVGGTTNILQSYNTGSINGGVVAGLVANIENNDSSVSIIKSYNTGTIIGASSSALVSSIKNNTGNISFNKVLNNNNSAFMIRNIENSNVDISDSYTVNGTTVDVGVTTGTFGSNTLSKSFVTSIGYDEFVDNEDLLDNSGHAWIYEESLPILFIDDIINPIAILHVGSYNFNDIGYELSEILFSSPINYIVEEVSDINPIGNVYYHIENSNTPLNRAGINSITDWNSKINPITTDGKYIIYAKVYDSTNLEENVTYINSDVLVLDTIGSDVTISGVNREWNVLDDEVSTIYIDSPKSFTVTGEDLVSGIKEISYYLSNSVITDFSDITFSEYTDGVSIDSYGSYIIYAKVTDNTDHITYVNSDIISYGGYSIYNVYVGRDRVNDNINITNRSNITFDFSYSDNTNYDSGSAHAIVSNVALPINTKITLIDNITKNKYVYVTDSEVDRVLFSSFKKLGMSSDEYFVEPVSGSIDENYSVKLDFSNTSLLTLSNVIIHLEMLSNGVTSRSTLVNTYKPFSIYDSSASLGISTSFNGVIGYDSTNTYSIPLSIALNYGNIGGNRIVDTTYEDKSIGFMIKLVDDSNNIISKEYLKNISFSIGDTYYYPSNDGVVRIKLNNGLNSFNGNLIINTTLDNSNLSAGTYYFKINSFASYDGEYSNELSSSVVTIPVENNTYKNNYSFDVIYNNTSRIVNKLSDTALSFSILQNGVFTSPNVRMSLYKKKELTAYNQEYVLVDLATYVTNELESIGTNTYYAVKHPLYFNGLKSTYNNITLNLINNNFEYNSYKIVFELYDNNTFISKIGETFIVK